MRNIYILAVVFLAISCVEDRKTSLENNADGADDSKYRAIEVIDAIPAGGYTYVQALEKGDTIWMAMGQKGIEKGRTYYYVTAMEMKNFPSKELDRTFETIYFLDNLLDNPREPLPGELHTQSQSLQSHSAPVVAEIAAEEGVTSIADLYEKRDELAGKKVTVKGQVTKVNIGIMDRNWIHIQDGTGGKGDSDLTITTNAAPKVGEIVKFTGTVAIDKDFTMGYKYEVLVEDAILPDTEM